MYSVVSEAGIRNQLEKKKKKKPVRIGKEKHASKHNHKIHLTPVFLIFWSCEDL